jgi:uncharacterized Zn-finger protein
LSLLGVYGKNAVKKEFNLEESLENDLIKTESSNSEIKPSLTETKVIGGEEFTFHKCPSCESSFERMAHLKRHISSVHEDKRPHACTECDMKFKQKYHLKRHFASAHGAEFDPDFNVKEEAEEGGEENYGYDESYDQNYDDQSYSDYLQTNLEENDYEYIDYQEEQIDEDYKPEKKKPKQKRGPRVKKEAGEKQEWKCTECDEQFTREDPWKDHMNDEHGITQPFSCTICGTRFSANRGLKKHMLLVHSDKRPFPCDQCDFKVKIKYHLTRHVERKANPLGGRLESPRFLRFLFFLDDSLTCLLTFFWSFRTSAIRVCERVLNC